MSEVEEMLHKRRTDVETAAAETEVIEMLGGAFSKACEGRSDRSGASMMAMLMRMLTRCPTGTGSSPGGSMAGGFTDDANMTFNGKGFSGTASSRNFGGTHGSASGKLPEEFKSDIEAFLRKSVELRE